jgi:hypothetical protein
MPEKSKGALARHLYLDLQYTIVSRNSTKEDGMPEIARTRADVDIFAGPKSGSEILDRFSADCLVKILEEKDGWYKIKPERIQGTVAGYVP